MSSGSRTKAKREGKKTTGFKDTYSGLSDTAKQDYLNYIESLTQLQGLQEGMGGAQASYDEALAQYQGLEGQRTDVLDAKNKAMFVETKDQFGNVTGHSTKGYKRGFGEDYNANRAMAQFDRMIENVDLRLDRGENTGEYRYSDEDFRGMLDNMKQFGSEDQYDQMVEKLKDQDRQFTELQFSEDYDAAQAEFAPELTAAASQVQAMRDQYGESSAEAQAAYDQYEESFKKVSGMKYGEDYAGDFMEESDLAELGGNTGMGFDLMDQEQIDAMSSDELTAYLNNLTEYYG